uniref:Protein kinase domain-containing protein n=1 Tax=Ananas comosus var. bracteatus TaxID=296719 RepID=A0A6V7P5L1_ANACO|nr:unnamed protein product [Ananas comosus var. bracteatus]
MAKSSSWKLFCMGCFGGVEEISTKKSTKGGEKKSSHCSNNSSSSPSRLSFSSFGSTQALSPEDLSLTLSGSNLHVFTLAELKAATKNFSTTNFLGSGGFGPVYKGFVDEKLRPGLRLSREWLAEVIFLGQLRHPHLVKLIGYCYEDEHRMLVYEYMTKGSLENHLFKRYLAALPWSARIKIAVEAAKGLAFLHDAERPVIYRDFKASNILLDSDFKAKLSDFGLAKDGPQGDDTHVTTRVMGTQGYAAPEYILTGHLTTKSDVYSFGVVLLELLSGRRCVDRARRDREQNLVDWARPYLKKPDKLYRIMDPTLELQYSHKGAQKAAAVAYQCLSHRTKSRPSMKEVVEALEPLLELGDVPIGTFVFTVKGDEGEENETKKIDMKVELTGREEQQSDHHDHHHMRHKKRYPNSAIHAEIVLRRDRSGSYTNSLRKGQSSPSHQRDRGA